jgi:uncharacterized protein (DUF1330 family)
MPLSKFIQFHECIQVKELTRSPPAASRRPLTALDRRRLPMAKGYWIARVDVKNEEAFKPYAEANAAILKKFRGRFLILGDKFDAMEGHSRTRNVVIEFPDYASALACYRSPEYQENIKPPRYSDLASGNERD